MSKPQIDTFKANAFCQLTAQEVSERLRRMDCAPHLATVKVMQTAGKSEPTAKTIDLSDVPEHLF